MDSCHLLRPDWLWLFLPLLVLLWILARRRARAGSWRAVCDPQLLPFILQGREVKQGWLPLLFVAIGGVLAILSLSGPVCEQRETPVFREQSALVIALDLSRSMDAADLKPSRLTRARLKLVDVLQQRQEGQTALLVYAAEAFAVTPLTQDSNTIIAQAGSLTTDLLPAQGSRTDLALDKASDLLQQAGIPRGDILLITDGINGQLEKLQAAAGNHRLSILGVGTAAGAPIKSQGGGFVTDKSGAIVVPKLDESSLRELAMSQGGRYAAITADNRDLQYILQAVDGKQEESSESDNLKTDQWVEEGPWLLLPLLVLAALAFRRGYLAVLVLVIMPLGNDAYAFELKDLFFNSEQQAQQQLDAGDAKAAAQNFTNPEWKAAAHYRAGEFEEAANALAGSESVDGLYNRGNALANMGVLDKALEAYEAALEKNPDHEDAKYNRDLVKKELEKQQQENQGEDGEKSEDGEGESSDEKQDGQQGEQQSEDKQQGDQQSQEQQPGDSEQQQGSDGEKQSAKPEDAEQQEQQETEQQQAQQGEKDDEPGDKEQQSLEQSEQEQDEKKDGKPEQHIQQSSEEKIATEQWLRRIPDDPGGLLRRKFEHQYQQKSQAKQRSDEEQAW